MKKEREIVFYKQYFQDFYLKQNGKVREKIGYVFRVIKTVDKIPEKFLKHIEGTTGLYEIRVEVDGNIFRIFCCFDEENLVVLFNGMQKKTQKTPKRTLNLALKLKEEYLTAKN